ncbi:hypothetical protein [Actinomadura napierensis]|uniref:Uncharacterized protein n=1 Tax=Actinomadura napierensis TaxID=267854 RepID=A0ABP5MBF8_9ACTN
MVRSAPVSAAVFLTVGGVQEPEQVDQGGAGDAVFVAVDLAGVDGQPQLHAGGVAGEPVVAAQHRGQVVGEGVQQMVGGDVGRDDEQRPVATVFAVARRPRHPGEPACLGDQDVHLPPQMQLRRRVPAGAELADVDGGQRGGHRPVPDVAGRAGLVRQVRVARVLAHASAPASRPAEAVPVVVFFDAGQDAAAVGERSVRPVGR